jgi:hypothetical protein
MITSKMFVPSASVSKRPSLHRFRTEAASPRTRLPFRLAAGPANPRRIRGRRQTSTVGFPQPMKARTLAQARRSSYLSQPGGGRDPPVTREKHWCLLVAEHSRFIVLRCCVLAPPRTAPASTGRKNRRPEASCVRARRSPLAPGHHYQTRLQNVRYHSNKSS